MTTGDNFLQANSTRLFSLTDLNTRLLSYLKSKAERNLESVYPDDGVFGELSFDISSADELTIVGTVECTDGEGHLMNLSNATVDGSGLPFENTAATTYYVALEYAELPDGIQINPRTGGAEYTQWREDVGRVGVPDQVTDNGNGTLTFRVNSVLESAVDHSDRQVMVWKVTPGDLVTVVAEAIETRTTAYAAPNNSITTVGNLGQTTPSTTASDYRVALLGPRIERTDLSAVDGIVFLGTVTGGGAGLVPTASDTSGQNSIEVNLSNFNSALDGFISAQETDGTKTGALSSTNFLGRAFGATAHDTVNDVVYCLGGTTTFANATFDSTGAGTTDTAANRSYDPDTNTWTIRANIATSSIAPAVAGRYGCKAVYLNGFIYLCGGFDGGGIVAMSHLQRYETATNTWDVSNLAALPAARGHGGFVTDGTYLYWAGGMNAGAHDDLYRYDVAGNNWTTLNVMPGNRFGFGCVYHDGFIYVLAGIDNQNRNTCYRYSIATGNWSSIAAVESPDLAYGSSDNGPGVGRYCEAVVVNNVIHLIGGWAQPGFGTPINEGSCAHHLYSPTADEWTHADFIGEVGHSTMSFYGDNRWAMAPCRTQRAPITPLEKMNAGKRFGQFMAATVDGRIIVAGGVREDIGVSNNLVTDSVISFDASRIHLASSNGVAVATGEWERRGVPSADPFPAWLTRTTNLGSTTARWGQAACALKGRIHVTGGRNATTWFATHYAYDPATNTWTRMADLPALLEGHGQVASEERNRLYVAHGYTGVSYTNELYAYNPDLNTWETLSTTFGTIKHYAGTAIWGNRIYSFCGWNGVAVLEFVYWDLNTNSQTTLNTPAAATYEAALVALPEDPILVESPNHVLLAFGGVTTPNEVYRYNVELDSWSVVGSYPNLSSGRIGCAAEYMHDPNDGQRRLPHVIVTGGRTAAAAGWVATCDEIYPHVNEVNAASITPNMPAAISNHAMASLDGVIFVFGGRTAAAVPYSGAHEYRGSAYNRIALPKNYSNRLEGWSVGFKEGQIYGRGTWDPTVPISYIRIGENAA